MPLPPRLLPARRGSFLHYGDLGKFWPRESRRVAGVRWGATPLEFAVLREPNSLRDVGTTSMEAGIVGLPNVGKSTLFNALTAAGVASESYPFSTKEANVGAVAVPDPRLDR